MFSDTSISSSAGTDPYEVRTFDEGDTAAYLALYDHVLSGGGEDWFAWKYEDNPFLDDVPIVVATRGDDLVGAKSAVPMRLRAGDATVDALQPADTMVHPDHRRRGLFSRMTEFMKEHYATRSPSLFFNFPNEKTLAGGLKHGWELVERLPTYYRVQRVGTMAGEQVPDTLEPGLAALDLAVDAYHSARERDVSVPDDATVDERDGVPGESRASLYRRHVPGAFHAERSQRFYEWRFGNPDWSYRTFLAEADGQTVGVVTGAGVENDERIVNVVDVVPLAGPDRRGALAAALEAVCTASADADVVAASGRAVPDDLLRSFGFLPDTELPLSPVASPQPYVAYPLTDDGWTVADRDVRRPDNWLMTFAEQDTR